VSARALLIKRRRQLAALADMIGRAESEGDTERLDRLHKVIGPADRAVSDALAAVRELNEAENPRPAPAAADKEK
jgi:hypothetical protein